MEALEWQKTKYVLSLSGMTPVMIPFLMCHFIKHKEIMASWLPYFAGRAANQPEGSCGPSELSRKQNSFNPFILLTLSHLPF
jgi:hypothetical protein